MRKKWVAARGAQPWRQRPPVQATAAYGRRNARVTLLSSSQPDDYEAVTLEPQSRSRLNLSGYRSHRLLRSFAASGHRGLLSLHSWISRGPLDGRSRPADVGASIKRDVSFGRRARARWSSLGSRGAPGTRPLDEPPRPLGEPDEDDSPDPHGIVLPLAHARKRAAPRSGDFPWSAVDPR
jgi:hypothetical protein